MTGVELALAAAIMAAGAVVQGSIGFGLNVVAAPLLVLIDTRFVPGPALVCALFLSLLVGARERGAADRKGVAWILAGRVPGTIVGGQLVGVFSGGAIAIALSVMVLLDVASSAVGLRLRRRPAVLAGVGAVSGVMGTLTSIGGPPVAMLYQDVRGPELRATLSAIFAIGTAMSVATLVISHNFGHDDIVTALALLPGVLIGFVASRWTARWLDRGRVRPIVLGVCAGAALAALVRYAV